MLLLPPESFASVQGSIMLDFLSVVYLAVFSATLRWVVTSGLICVLSPGAAS